ncbi:hypothetical protein ZYGR_0H03570 [Zygosaccharomyces rouxii]|uniref:C2H2-type domain-containing protein n=1 Tax=Zygosaccharomyces rouxii TaxID=4956 RepID=A0A1Q2ZW40_ZYGRO|nr:hypothetical protein ZYGR_0H03570 [Zygosaccharomyces rouxii]
MSLPSPVFTCNACVIQFKSSDLQRYHMKTEWHRYNLKRRVAELPPIGADVFAEKLQISEREKAENQVDEFGFALLKPANLPKEDLEVTSIPHKGKKGIRRKSNESSKDQGNSINEKSLDSPANASDISDSEGTTTDFGENTASEYGFTSDSNWESESEIASVADSERILDSNKVTITDCIYCGLQNRDVNRNINHMFEAHGLYIPERSYLADLPGLLNFLIQEIVIKKLCLCCNFQGSSFKSIRDHMLSKRHCKMPYETKEEREKFAQFYDFSSLNESDVDHKESDKSSKKKIHFKEEDEEIDDDDDDDDTFDGHQINSNYTTVELDDTGLELTLPNGARAGHRIGQRYFRQNLPPSPESRDSRATVSAADRRLASGITERQWKQGMKDMRKEEQKAMNRQLRRQKPEKINFQPHYRDEFLQ